jgi:long-subunit fatty acid transport protein
VSTVQGLVPGSLSSLPIESPLFEAQAVTSLMTAHNIGFNGGVFFQPVPYVDLGLSFLLPVNITYRGTVDITLPDVLTLGQPALSTIGFDGRTVTADGEISTLRPGMIMGGISWRSTEALTMDTVFIFSFNSQRSSFKTELFNTGLPYLDAPEGTSIRLTGADNAYQARFGAKYRFNPTLMTGGYITYIDAGIPSAYVTASNIGFNLLIPTWLLEYAYEPESKFACSFSPIFALPRTVSDSAFNSLLPANSGLGIPTGNGDYRGFGVQLGLSYTQHF